MKNYFVPLQLQKGIGIGFFRRISQLIKSQDHNTQLMNLEEEENYNYGEEKIYNYAKKKWGKKIAKAAIEYHKLSPITFCRWKMLYGCYPYHDICFLYRKILNQYHSNTPQQIHEIKKMF